MPLLPDTPLSTHDSMPDLLTPTQHQVIALLAQGQSITAAAAACHVHRTTVHYWKRESPDFADALRDAQADAADHWRAVARQHAEAAFNTIQHLMTDPKTPPSVRLKAALFILKEATGLPRIAAEPPRRPQPEYDPIEHFHTELEAISNQHLAEQRALMALEYGPERVEAAIAWNDEALSTNSGPLPEIPPILRNRPYVRPTPKTGRNEKCPCQSGRKYKHCCLNKKPPQS